MNTLDKFLGHLAGENAVLVTVHSSRGSVPREVGAWMAVFADETVGTVGGGHLEWQAIEEARVRLVTRLNPDMEPIEDGPDLELGDEPVARVLRYSLGPSLGQCCGGEVYLSYHLVRAQDVEALRERLSAGYLPVTLFGGGHVGRAIVNVLATLPVRLSWQDSRDEIFPAGLPSNVVAEHCDPIQAGVADVPAGSVVLIMSFSHAEDLEVVAACLTRQRERGDLRHVGLIGSKTKWASFRSRLRERGFSDQELDGVTCPIGIEGVAGKEPEVIAVAVAAQILRLSRGPAA